MKKISIMKEIGQNLWTLQRELDLCKLAPLPPGNSSQGGGALAASCNFSHMLRGFSECELKNAMHRLQQREVSYKRRATASVYLSTRVNTANCQMNHTDASLVRLVLRAISNKRNRAQRRAHADQTCKHSMCRVRGRTAERTYHPRCH
jgi:hypothetical protein